MRRPVMVVCGLLIVVGCSQKDDESSSVAPVPQEETNSQAKDGWGPGVTDPDAVRAEIIRLLSEPDVNDYDLGYVHGMFNALTWKQAAYVYRTSPILVRGSLVDQMIGMTGPEYIGMTRGEVIAALGPPDGDFGGADGIAYTGVGHASDSTSGFVFEFSPDGKIKRVVCAN